MFKFEKVTITKRITKRGSGGFGSRAMSVIKQAKKDPNDKEEQKISEAIVKKPGDDLQIVYKEAILKVDNEVVVNEKITINLLFLDRKNVPTNRCLCVWLLFWILYV